MTLAMCRHICHQKGDAAGKAQQLKAILGNTECGIQYAAPKHMMRMVPNTLAKRAAKLLLI